MAALPVLEFLKYSEQSLVLDVRSPAEYAAGHIPKAVSLPLFDDAERAEVGTLYKQVSPQAALLRGLEIAGHKMAHMVKQVSNLYAATKASQVAVYCWRGGKRSASVAWLLATSGMSVVTLQKGYKAFRQFVLNSLSVPHKLVVLGGRTGSGKTQLLHLLAQRGVQIVDLEALAQHRGSVFGSLLKKQPTQVQFENELGLLWSRLNPQLPVVVEDESRLIGKLVIPQPIWQAMRQAKVIYLDIPWHRRLNLLLQDYQTTDKLAFSSAFLQIERRLGSQRTKEALSALDRGDLSTAAAIALEYYDRAYDYGLSKREPTTIYRISGSKDELLLAVMELLSKI